jgi:uncharacterized repeat protein (TIGR01451 family)
MRDDRSVVARPSLQSGDDVMFDHKSHSGFRRAPARDRRGSRSSVPLRLIGLEDRSMPVLLALPAVADNTLYEHDTGQLSNGAGQHLYVGKTGALAGNKVRRAVVRFDLSAIPAGSTINAATLTLHVSRPNNGAQPVDVHRLLNSWGEGTSNAGPGAEGDGTAPATNDATWIHRFFNTQNWTTPGGDFATAVSATQTINAVGSYNWTGTGLTADVQAWFANSATNHGWILIGNEASSLTAKELSSRQNSTTANRPSLTVDYTPPALPDLTVDKSHVGDFRQGDPDETYSILVSNIGPGSTSGTVTATDTLPTGLVPTADNNGTINGWNVSVNGQTVTATRGNVLAGGNSYPVLPIIVAVAANAPPSVTNTASVAGGGQTNTTNDSDSDPTNIIQVADLTINKTHVGDFRQGDPSQTYSLVVQNVGPGPTSGTVTVTDTLPTGLTPTSDNTGVINGWTVSFNGQTVTATRNNVLANGNSYPVLPIVVAVAANAPPSVTNTATVAGGGQLNTTNDSDDDPTTIIQVADLTVTKTHAADFRQGAPSETYSILVQNVGPGPTVGTVTISDTLPTGLTPTNDNTGTVNGWNVSFAGQTVTATRNNVLANGGSYPALPIVVAVAANAPASVVNTATVSGGGQLNTANDSDDDPTNIVPVADLVIDKSHVGDFTQGDKNRTYTLRVQNIGAGATTGTVTITDIVPTGLTPTAANTGVINGWNVSFAGQTVTASRADALGAADTYPDLPLIIDVEFDAPATVVNTATVAGGGEVVTGNNSDNDPTTIHPYTAPNQPPVNTLPATFSTNEDIALVLTGLSVMDPDAGSSDIEMTLTVSSGTLAVLTDVAGGVTAGQVTGNGTATLVLIARQSAINATLAAANGLRFTPALNASGTGTLTMTTDDLGHNGTGGPLSDSDLSSIAIAAVNDAPVNTLPPTGSTPADTPLALTGISIADVDADANAVSVVLGVTTGRLAIDTSVASGVTAADVSGNDTGLVTVFAPLAAINTTLAAVNGLIFAPPAAFTGSATLTLVTNDLGSSGNGGAKSDSDTQAITVTRVLDHFTIDVPAVTTAGVAFNVTVTARNAAGNVIANHGGSINLSTGDPQGTVPANATFTNGVATFAATLRTAGPQTIQVTDAAEPSISAQRSIPVTPAAAVRLTFQQQPTGTIVGAPFLPAVQVVARDAFNNVATNTTEVVRIRLQNNPVGAIPTGTATARLAGGVATFPTLGIGKAGVGFTLSASSASLPATISDPFSVSAVVRFTALGAISSTAGSSFNVTVRALDSRGLVVTGYAGKVHFSSSDPQAVLPPDSTLVNGEATFPVTLRTAGTRTLTVADLGKATARGTAKTTVTPAAVSGLRATGLVEPTKVGLRQLLTVAAVDAFGNINPGYRGTVALTSTDAAAALPPAFTFSARDAGKHVFPVTLNTAGLQSISAGDGALTGVRANVVVAGLAATVVSQPDPADAAKTALVVLGTAKNDVVEVSPTNAAGTQLEVRINGVSHGTTFAPTGHVLVYGLAGNDTVRLLPGSGPLAAARVAVSSVLEGGLGNDSVDATGASAPTILVGRDGNDVLTGSSDRDLLIGGKGKDGIRGGAGDDLLVSGPTLFDTDLSALLAMMSEWSHPDTDFVTRVQHLSGTPGGSNGPNVLTAATVPNDTSIDQLFGESDRDWFLFTASGKMLDQVLDVAAGEVLTGL